MNAYSVFAAAPATERLLGIPGPVLQGLLLLAAVTLFAFILGRRLVLLTQAAPDDRRGHVGERLRSLFVVGFGQSRQPRYPIAGTIHILIFAGFLVLFFRSLTLLGEGFVEGFTLPGFGGTFGQIYAGVKDWVALTVLVCCAVAAYRRVVVKPARYHDRTATRSHGAEGLVILGMIAVLLLADGLYEGTAMAEAGRRSVGLPLGSAFAALTAGLGEGARNTLHLAGFWIHNIVLLAFLCYLPLSKHFHVITALPNTYLAKLAPAGRVKPPRYGVDDMDELETLGVRHLEDFTWKHLLDAYSCTDCGRCSDNCPAYATGTPLSPRMISIKTRDEAYRAYPVFGRTIPAGDRPTLVGDIIRDEEFWACTTCGACEDACPVLIEYVDKIVDMRRGAVDDGRVPASLQKALADIEKKGNPYGKMARKRADWTKGGDDGAAAARVLKKGEQASCLFFTDSCTAFDPRIQRIGRAFTRLLDRSGVDVGTLGKDEVDSGNEVRRIGEEGLFEVLRDKNTEAIAERDCASVVTSDPHAFNALRNDYTLEQPVEHHTQTLDRLLAEGRLRLQGLGDGRTYTFHDPCYLGRHNDEYDAPRRVLDAIPGLKTVEMERSRNKSFCCGGGSLYLFYEGESERRMGEMRLDMAAEAGAEVVVTACPFCLINLEDALKTTGRAEAMEVIDLAELVERAAAPPSASRDA